MFSAIVRIFRTPDLRKKILFTLAMVAVYRLGATVPSPGVSYGAIQQCIDEEDKRKPLTDETLMDILNSKGYRIARRTVAKYREMLSIPVARLRKQI